MLKPVNYLCLASTKSTGNVRDVFNCTINRRMVIPMSPILGCLLWVRQMQNYKVITLCKAFHTLADILLLFIIYSWQNLILCSWHCVLNLEPWFHAANLNGLLSWRHQMSMNFDIECTATIIFSAKLMDWEDTHERLLSYLFWYNGTIQYSCYLLLAPNRFIAVELYRHVSSSREKVNTLIKVYSTSILKLKQTASKFRTGKKWFLRKSLLFWLWETEDAVHFRLGWFASNTLMIVYVGVLRKEIRARL